MAADYKLTMKPKFVSALMALPKNDQPKIVRALQALSRDPMSGGAKKRLKGHDNLMRVRADDYRVFYVVGDGYVSVIDVRRRKDDTYARMPAAEDLGVGDTSAEVPPSRPPPPAAWAAMLLAPPAPEVASTPLPVALDPELLARLRIPAAFHEALAHVATEEALLDAEEVPEAYRLRIIDALSESDLEATAHQPDLWVEDLEDLVRYQEGELLAFLLRLNPEQEALVTLGLKSRNAADAPGPVLVKGGPGTGKSTVALYRTRAIVRRLRKAGQTPRVLFTTYTRALTRFSEQLLVQLLGEEASGVEVVTADSIAMRLARAAAARTFRIADASTRRKLVASARASATFEGNALAVAGQRRALERFSVDYLSEEILGVIEGRGLSSYSEYQEAPRPGRRIGLNRTQRRAVWAVRCRLRELLEAQGLSLFEDVRRQALAAVQAGGGPRYDAVVIDEAQDLSPVSLALLVALRRPEGHLFLTADANQSIYGGAFRWQDVHQDLQFQGRTGVLRANHRSTRQVAEAAAHYLAMGGALDEAEAGRFVHRGPLPVVRRVADARDEVDLLGRFFTQARRSLRLTLSSCALLCPTRKGGQRLAEDLTRAGLRATFMDAEELDLEGPGVKVLTLQSAKGLEFPIVALAGFIDAGYPFMPAQVGSDERDEIVTRGRRTIFVAMTRAMRALLVARPAAGPSDVWRGFGATLWNIDASDPDSSRREREDLEGESVHG